MPYGILYLPDDRTSKLQVAYARSAAPEVRAIMQVDEVRRPHVTLLHVDCDRERATELWQLVKAAVPPQLTLIPTGTQIAVFPVGDAYVPEGGVYVGLEILRKHDLAAAHHEVREYATDLALPTRTPSGENFRPHVTLAVVETAERVSLPVPRGDLMAPFTGSLALGEMGPYGTFPDIIDTV